MKLQNANNKTIGIKLISLLVFLLFCLTVTSFSQDKNKFLSLQFDEVNNGKIKEGISGKEFPIQGNFELVDGVKGKALNSDGFTTLLEVTNPEWRLSLKDFSLEAWVAMETYGWNDVAIIDSKNGENLTKGMYMGINSEGFPVFGMAIEGSWKSLTASKKIDLYEWAHVCVVYDHNVGIKIFLNGEEVGFLNKTGFPTYNNKLRIARNSYDMIPDHVHRPYGAFPSKYSFDGILDEISGYTIALSTEEVKATFQKSKPTKQAPITQRYLPKGPESLPKDFSAYMTQLKFYPEYDAVWRSDAPQDIVISFEKMPFRIVAWRGIRSAPCMVIKNNTIDNDIWIADQSAEYFSSSHPTNDGCSEHMSDAQCRYSRVRLIEDNAARKVIHWRYAPTDVLYNLPFENNLTGWSTWIDEYYYIYPDGVYTRGYHSFTDDDAPIDQYQETTIVNPPGTYPDDNVEKAAITLADHSGNEITYIRKENLKRTNFPGLSQPNIQLLNIKADIKPFIIMDPEAVSPKIYNWNTGINSYFSMWNHFPVAQQAPTDGRQAVYSDRTSSSAFAWMKMTKPYKTDSRKDTYVYLTGATDKKASQLVKLSKSWNNAPDFILLNGKFESRGYEKFERAYLLTATDTNHGNLSGKVNASPEQPVVNPAFSIEKWGDSPALVKINGKPLSKNQYQYGYEKTMEGTKLIVFIELEETRPFNIKIEKR